MEQARAERYVCPFDIAVIYAALADRERTLRWLREALKVRDHAMLFAKVDPALDNVRADPDFRSIIGEI